jgi:hypothetical protein
MMRLPALLSVLAAGGLFLVTTIESHPEWLRPLGLDWGGVADARERLVIERGRAVQLWDELTKIEHRRAMREQIVQEVLGGRLDLLTAASRFRDVNSLCPAVDKVVAGRYPGVTAEERACRHLLAWMKEGQVGTPTWSSYQPVHARLEAELDRYLRARGEARSPRNGRD